jgi:hypothetical protein
MANSGNLKLFQWRWILPIVQLAIYLLLIGLAERPSGPNGIIVDPIEPLARRFALAINSPALFVANVVAKITGQHNFEFIIISVGGLLLFQWYGVGWWIDIKRRRGPYSTIHSLSITGWCAILFLIGIWVFLGSWYHLLVNEPWLLRTEKPEVFFGCIAWPSFLLFISGQQLLGRFRYQKSLS